MLRTLERITATLGLTLLVACAKGSEEAATAAASGASGAGGSATASACAPCVTDHDCAAGSKCGQFGGDTYCAPDCSDASACAPGRACVPVVSFDGNPERLCVPITDPCGGQPGATNASASSASGAGGGAPETCGSLRGPELGACCGACKTSGHPCQQNGCYGGFWCNVDTCRCQAPPSPSACGSGGGGSGGGPGGGSGGSSGGGGSVGINGGTLDTLSFAIVGDTRPPNIDDTAGYPKVVIQKIWQDVEAQSPRPAFAITTGDYMFASPKGSQAAAQLDLYLAARAAFTGTVFPALGNHECTGATASNCGAGNTDGITTNYAVFMSKMLAPLGVTTPYYTVNIGSTSKTWTAKFVFVAANAWSAAQASWLAAELAKPTTYTFVVRHEGSSATQAPGVTPSAQIMKQHPYTLLLAGHTHTFEYLASSREVITGNGGAPLTGAVNYGYVIARQRADGAIELRELDYATNAVQTTFAVKADGTKAP